MPWFALAAGLAMVVAASACGGDGGGGGGGDPLALDEYLGSIERINNENETRIDAARSALENLTADSDFNELKSAFSEVYDEFVGIVADSRDQIDGIEPPDEAQDAHDDLVAGFDALEQAFDSGRERIEDATTIEELDAAVTELDASEAAADATGQLERACTSLQTLADENNVDVDLRCGTEG